MGEKSLKEKTVSGLSWSATDKLFQQIFIFLCGILLARMLTKESYGLIGVLGIFTGIANLLQESGFTTALIRKKNATEDDYVTVFYTNIAISIILYLILFFLAPLIGSFHDNPELVPLSRFVFLSFLFNSFAIIQTAKLLKELDYSLKTKINLFSVLISYGCALLLAYLGYEAWALASQIVIITFVRSVCLWIFGKWRPKGRFSYTSFREFFSFGSKLVAGGVMNSFTTNIPQNIIEKQYSLGVTGLYAQASRLFNTIFDFVTGTIQAVPFPVLSSIDDEVRLKKAFRKFIRAKALVICPLFMGMILVAQSFISALLGSKWDGTAPILQLLCIGGFFASMDMSSNDLLRVKGKAGTILSLEVFRNILIAMVLIVSILLKADYLYMVGGLSATYLIKYIASLYITNKIIGYKTSELLKDLLPYFAVALFSVLCGYLLKYIIPSQLLLFICQIIFVGIIYFSILYFSGSVLVKETLDLIKKSILKKR